METQRKCEHCHELFIPKRVDTVYCSPSCRQLAYIKRKQHLNNSLTGLELTDNRQLSDKHTAGTEWLFDITGKNDNAFGEMKKNVNPVAISENVNLKNVNINSRENENVNAGNVNSYQIDFKTSNPDPEVPYVGIKSRFVEAIWELVGEMDGQDRLSTQYLQLYPKVHWVCLRFRCLIESLLTFSEMKEVELDDLKEVYNAFVILMNTPIFKAQPESFPYFSEMAFWRNSLKELCMSEEERIRFRMKLETKTKLIAIRFELSQYVPKEPFNGMEFHFDIKR